MKQIHLYQINSNDLKIMKTLISFLFLSLFYFQCNAQQNVYITTDKSFLNGRNGEFDTPFNTINDMLVKVRSLNQSNDVNVYFMAGTYYLDNTISLSSADGGRNGHKVIYKPYNNAKVVISGGIPINNNIWLPADPSKNIWSVNLSTYSQFSGNFGIRYINGKKCSRAKLKSSDTGFKLDASGDLLYYSYNNSTTTIADLLKSITNPTELEVVSNRTWQCWRNRVQSINSTDKKIILQRSEPVPIPNYEGNAFDVLYLENAYQFIDEPYEWYFDRTSKLLYLKLNSGENPNNVVVSNPNIEQLISGNGVANIEFQNLTFSHSSWFVKDISNSLTDMNLCQACWYYDKTGRRDFIPGSIQFDNSSNVNFYNNQFLHLGSIGLCFNINNQNITIQNNTFSDNAAEAIRISRTALKDVIVPYNIYSVKLNLT